MFADGALGGVDVPLIDEQCLRDEGAGAEAVAVEGEACDAGTVGVETVIAVLTGYDGELLRLSLELLVTACEFECQVDGIGSAAGEDDLGVVERGERRDPGLEGAYLLGGGLCDLVPAVADVGVPEAAGGVEETVPVRSGDVGAVAFDDDGLRVREHGRHVRLGAPQGVGLGHLHPPGIVCVVRASRWGAARDPSVQL